MQLSAFPSLIDPTGAASLANSGAASDASTVASSDASAVDFSALLAAPAVQPSAPTTALPASVASPGSDAAPLCATTVPLASVAPNSPLAPVLGAASTGIDLPVAAPNTAISTATPRTTVLAQTRPLGGNAASVLPTGNGVTAVPSTTTIAARAFTGDVSQPGADSDSDVTSADDDDMGAPSDDHSATPQDSAVALPLWVHTALAELQALAGPALTNVQFSPVPAADAAPESNDPTTSGVAAANTTAPTALGGAVAPAAASKTSTPIRAGSFSQLVSGYASAGSAAATRATDDGSDAYEAAMTAQPGATSTRVTGSSSIAESPVAPADDDVDTVAGAEPVADPMTGDADDAAESENLPLSVSSAPISRQAAQVQRAFGVFSRVASAAPADNSAGVAASRADLDTTLPGSSRTNSSTVPSPALRTAQPTALGAVSPDAANTPAQPANVGAGNPPSPLPISEDASFTRSRLPDPAIDPSATPRQSAPVVDESVTASSVRPTEAHDFEAGASAPATAAVTPSTTPAADVASAAVATTSQPSVPRVSPPTRSGGGRVEKIAAASSAAVVGGVRNAAASEKTGLVTQDEEVAESNKPLGINVAQADASMPAPAHNPTARPNEPMPFVAASAAADAAVKDASSGNPEIVRAATRAVDAALAMAEHFSNGAQRGVSLQFSVSGVDLAVRVEMRADGVHTTFRTDSPELRAALAQEWQQVTSTQSGDKPLRLADPVFTSQPATGFSADSGAANQRQPGARQNFSANSDAPSAFPEARRTSTETPAASPAPARWAGLISTSHHLHTFA